MRTSHRLGAAPATAAAPQKFYIIYNELHEIYMDKDNQVFQAFVCCNISL